MEKNQGTEDPGNQGTEDPGNQGTEDTFPRAYVEQLRGESASYRERATTAEQAALDLQARLHGALVAADGRLADPTDLDFDMAHLDTPEALQQAITDLIERKPHLKARSVSGDIGAGSRGESGAPAPDLISLIRGH